MENLFRALSAGIIVHFAAGLITASLWRLTAARVCWIKSHNHINNPDSKFWDAFSEIMIWPLYAILLFAFFIKSMVDLMLEIRNFMPRWKEKII